jgi:hypothetical protein
MGAEFVSPKNAQHLEKLQARLTVSRTAVRVARENLIEALGDHMCGSGGGPTPEDLRALALASSREAKLLLELAKLATESALLECRHEPREAVQPQALPDVRPHKR